MLLNFKSKSRLRSFTRGGGCWLCACHRIRFAAINAGEFGILPPAQLPAGDCVYTGHPGQLKPLAPKGEHSFMHTKTISMLLGAMLSTGVVLAQTPEPTQPANNTQATQTEHARRHHAPPPDRMAAHLKKKLNLPDAQESQIKPILESRVQQLHALRSESTLTAQERHTKARDIIKDSDTQIEAVLNPTQKQQFEQMMQKRRAHHKMAQQPSA
jgi:protein CpxP